MVPFTLAVYLSGDCGLFSLFFFFQQMFLNVCSIDGEYSLFELCAYELYGYRL